MDGLTDIAIGKMDEVISGSYWFQLFLCKKMRYGRIDQWTDQRCMKSWSNFNCFYVKKGLWVIDGPTDEPMIRTSYRNAGTHLKTKLISTQIKLIVARHVWFFLSLCILMAKQKILSTTEAIYRIWCDCNKRWISESDRWCVCSRRHEVTPNPFSPSKIQSLGKPFSHRRLTPPENARNNLFALCSLLP